MKKIVLFLVILILIAVVSCRTEGVEKNQTIPTDQQQSQRPVDSLEMDLSIKDKLVLDNGIEITWLEKSSGEDIKPGDVISIDYKVRLQDSTIVDGNFLLKKPYLPYIVGFGFQPKGWDIALSKMKIGDFARIKIPAKYARENKEIKNLVPKNSDNYLTIRVLSKIKPSREIDGVKVWVLEENKKHKEKFTENNKVEFYTTISSPTNPFYFNSYANNQPFVLKLEDNGIVPGLKKALINAKKGDRMFILVPAKEAYGTKGYLNLVKPNEDLFYNLLVTDIIE